MSLSAKALKEAYDIAGLPAIADELDKESNEIAGALLRVAQTQGDVALDNFNRGQWTAYEAISTLLRNLK